ncbi:diguanylate cyclase [Litoribrevibacter albus]|nr:diguanylate cyclase [Litoribrevibacter albus]
MRFTEEEVQWIQQHKQVTLCVDPDWLPFESISSDGRHIGIAADYFDLFSRVTGLTFSLVVTDSWVQSDQFLREGRCQILSLLNHSQERSSYLNFTEPYISSPVVIVTRDNEGYMDGLKALAKKNLSLVDGYVYEELIERDHPYIQIVKYQSSDQTLEAVSKGDVFATIGSLFIITERIQRLGLSNLKIVGPANYRNDLRVGVKKDEPILLSIMNKAVEAIEPKDDAEIVSRWVKVKYELGQDYDLAAQIALISFIILILLGYRSVTLSRYNRKLSDAYDLLERRTEELDRLSHTDALTSIPNRLRLDEAITFEVNRFKRYRTDLSLISLDIDNFKRVNDQHGHPVGDRLLIDIARLISGQLRSTDVFGRWGGEEFLILCPATAKEEAIIIAEKLRLSIQNTHFAPVGQVTVSFGVTSIEEGDGEKELVSRADKQLYRAKNEGRNRVCHD